MVLYVLICLVSVLVGCGILSVIGLEVNRGYNLFLAPVLTLCALATLMGGLVAGGFTVGEITPVVYILCLGAAVLGAIRYGKAVLVSWRALLILAGLPLLILLPSIVQGMKNYSGGLCMDGWSYVTVAQSIQRYPLGSEGWLSIDGQYAAGFGKATRFISWAFLALLAPLSGEHNDAQEVLGPYLGWLFFVYGSACLFFAKAARLRRPMVWIFLLVAMLTGWMLKIVNANSIDNALALCFLPAIFGILMKTSVPSARDGILLGVILGTVLYAYPESALFVGFAMLAMVCQRMLAARRQLREVGRMSLALLVTVILCILPYAPEIASFFRHEIHLARGAPGGRPGEPFYHPLSLPGYILQGFWGLTPDFDGRLLAETYLKNYNMYVDVAAYILTLAALFGVCLLLRRGHWSLPLFAVAMTAGYTITLVHFHYAYAAYKLLVLTWFVIVYLVIVTADYLYERLSQRPLISTRYICGAVGLGILTVVVGSFFLQERIFYDSLPFKSVRDFKKISAVQNLAQGGAVVMAVNETYANIWGLHFLRGTKLYLAGEYRGYMVGYASFMDRSELVNPSEIRFAVTDNEHSMDDKRLLSKAGPYSIWDCRRRPWVLLTEISNANGLEGVGTAQPFFWMGKGDTELRILSSAATSAIISARLTLGPGLPGKSQQRILIKSPGFEQERVIATGEQAFTVPLQAGLNRVLLRALEKPTFFLRTDSRPLLIHVAALSVSTLANDDTAQIRDIENPNGVQSDNWDGEEPFFWMGTQDTVVTIAASASGIAQLRTALVPGPSLVDKSRARLLIVPSIGRRILRDLNWGPARIDIPVRVGLNRIVMRAVGANVRTVSDPRIMMIGIRNLEASYRVSHEGTPCSAN